MPAKSEIDKIADLLSADSSDVRIAAAIVLGELGAKKPTVQKGLRAMLKSEGAPLQRAALEALTKIGAKAALPEIFALLNVRDASVRDRAAAAVASVGEAVVPKIKQRLETATQAERRQLELVLTQIGGVEAFGTLLERLASMGEKELRNAILELGNELKQAKGKTRQGYLEQVERYLDKLSKSKNPPPTALAAAIKLLGYLEADKAIAKLLAFAKDWRQPGMVRQEALLALKFALAKKEHAAKVMDALIAAAESDDRTLSQTALVALGGLSLPARLLSRLSRLANHPDIDRARFAISKLAEQDNAEAIKALVELLGTGEKKRAELAAAILEGRQRAVLPVINAMAHEGDPDRAWLMRKVLVASAGSLTPAQCKKLIDAAAQRLNKNMPGWEPMVDVARRANPGQTNRALREMVGMLKKAAKLERALALMHNLCAHEEVTDDDRYALISLELTSKKPQTAPNPRVMDMLDCLVRNEYDVPGALRRDEAIGLDELYHLGFYLVERDHPLGEELLSEVVEKAGRKKIGKMAHNKLKLAGFV